MIRYLSSLLFMLVSAPLLGAPPSAPATPVPLPNTEQRPYVWALYAHDQCAVVEFYSTGIVSTTSDEGRTWQTVVPTTVVNGRKGRPETYYCDGDVFIAAPSIGPVSRAVNGTWVTAHVPTVQRESEFRGLVAWGNRLYLGTGLHVLESTDRGVTWVEWLKGVDALAADNEQLIGSVNGAIVRIDAQRQLTPLGKAPGKLTAMAIAQSSTFALAGSSVYISKDGARTWKRVSGNSRRPPLAREAIMLGASVINAEGRHPRLEDINALYATPHGFWMVRNSKFIRVAELNDKRTDYAGMINPHPSLNAIGASGDTIVTSILGTNGLLQSTDAGRNWNSVCVNAGEFVAITSDRQRIQLQSRYGNPADQTGCRLPGLTTQTVTALPMETCNDQNCVRWRNKVLLFTHDRGHSWIDIARQFPGNKGVAWASVADQELLVADGIEDSLVLPNIKHFLKVWRSTDDGQHWQEVTLPGSARITAFAPSAKGWLLGTELLGLWRLPYAH